MLRFDLVGELRCFGITSRWLVSTQGHHLAQAQHDAGAVVDRIETSAPSGPAQRNRIPKRTSSPSQRSDQAVYPGQPSIRRDRTRSVRGNGATGRVALELGRKAIVIELNPEYCEMTSDRCKVTTGMLSGLTNEENDSKMKKAIKTLIMAASCMVARADDRFGFATQ